MAIIYSVVSPSGKFYIGKTKQELGTRRLRHLREGARIDDNGKYIIQTKFANAIRKYKDALIWSILYQDIPDSIVGAVESWTIGNFNAIEKGYNLMPGGEGGNTYATLSFEQIHEVKRKISEGVLRSITDERRAAMSERSRGKNNPMYGRKQSEETKRKIFRAKKTNKLLRTETFPKTVEKAWGKEDIIDCNKFYCMKRITIKAGHKTSLQYHEFKQETNCVYAGVGIYHSVVDGVKTSVPVGPEFVVTIKPGQIHRFEATEEDIILYEVSTPDIWDVVRLEDSYGREGTSAP